MGAVYRAEQLALRRKVAVKVLRGSRAHDLDAIRMFQREVMLASRLVHPNTIRVYDFGQSDEGLLYVVTELLEGETLAARLTRQRALPVPDAVWIATRVLESLVEAHDAGIVHRDIKPSNVFLARSSGGGIRVKVLDFGVAKTVDGVTASEAITTTGALVGTPAYMSPEQASAAAVDRRSDIYSLGVLLFRMLSGTLPYSADTTLALLNAHVGEPIPELVLPGGEALPPAVADAVRSCLAKVPSDRPPTARATIALLAEAVPGAEAPAADGEETIASTPRPDWAASQLPSTPSPDTLTGTEPAPAEVSTSRVPILLLAASVLTLAVVLLWQGPSQSPPQVIARPTEAPRPPAPASIAGPPPTMRATMQPARARRRAPVETPQTAFVLVRSVPRGARVLDAGGVDLGATPVKVPVRGEVVLKLVRRGYRPARVTVPAGRNAPLTVRLEPRGPLTLEVTPR